MATEPRSYFSIKEQNEPSLDTWVPSTNFLQVGFRPGYSLQARELIELQSILQNQISTFAQEIGYAHGSTLKICESDPRVSGLDVDPEGLYTASIRMNPGYMFIKNSNRIGYFVRYRYSLSDGTPITHIFQWTSNTQPNENSTKFAFFGFEYDEQTITPDNDIDLYDNAAGFPNFNAPGAVRYKINVDVDMKVKEMFLPISWNPPNDVNTGGFDNSVNRAVINDHPDMDGETHFASKNFVPLFYWSEHEPTILRIIHSNRDEYEMAYQDDGEEWVDQFGYSLFRKINPTNIQMLDEASDNSYERCGS